jgi:hypothetical protein
VFSSAQTFRELLLVSAYPAFYAAARGQRGKLRPL